MPLRSLRIFLVEDHADTRRCLESLLRSMGHCVVSASNLEEAVAKAPGADCNVLLSDIGLPDGEGWDLPRRVQLPPSVFTIAMSGFGMAADKARSHAAGFQHHLLKPFAPEELEELLAEAAQKLEPVKSSAETMEIGTAGVPLSEAPLSEAPLSD